MVDGRRFAAVAVMLMSAGVLSGAQARQGWDDDTHGRDAVPDYARVFPRDRVNRLDIEVGPADWQRLVDDMTDMAGPFGRALGRPGGLTTRIEPPPEAMAACAGKARRCVHLRSAAGHRTLRPGAAGALACFRCPPSADLAARVPTTWSSCRERQSMCRRRWFDGTGFGVSVYA